MLYCWLWFYGDRFVCANEIYMSARYCIVSWTLWILAGVVDLRLISLLWKKYFCLQLTNKAIKINTRGQPFDPENPHKFNFTHLQRTINRSLVKFNKFNWAYATPVLNELVDLLRGESPACSWITQEIKRVRKSPAKVAKIQAAFQKSPYVLHFQSK